MSSQALSLAGVVVAVVVGVTVVVAIIGVLIDRGAARDERRGGR